MKRTIVITGASSGIGAALARKLTGQNLVLAARRRQELEAVAREVSGRPVVTDVTRRQDVIRLRDEAIRVFGAVDVWVNNAGRGITRPVLELTDADFDETRRMVKELPFTYLHVFTYSPRPGTPAAAMPNQVPVQGARERNRILRELAIELGFRIA